MVTSKIAALFHLTRPSLSELASELQRPAKTHLDTLSTCFCVGLFEDAGVHREYERQDGLSRTGFLRTRMVQDGSE